MITMFCRARSARRRPRMQNRPPPDPAGRGSSPTAAPADQHRHAEPFSSPGAQIAPHHTRAKQGEDPGRASGPTPVTAFVVNPPDRP